MTRHVALLYSIIVSTTRRVTSGDLHRIAERAGVRPVRTVLSTGNLVFDADGEEVDLEPRLEAALVAELDRAIPVFVRSASEWRAVVAANPFPDETAEDPARVAARLLRRVPSPDTVERIRVKIGPGENIVARDRTLWLASPIQLSTSPLIRAAGANWAGEGTFRNASALSKIAAALDD